MTSEAIEKGDEWTRKLRGPGRTVARRSQRFILLGARFKRPWLGRSIHVSEVHFEGELAQALSDLQEIARQQSGKPGMALPVARLRASLVARLPGIFGIDRDLGIIRGNQPRRPALLLNRWEGGDSPEGSLTELVATSLRRWYQDAMSGWAEQHSGASVAARVYSASTSNNVRIVHSERPLLGTGVSSRPDYGLIVRQVGESLFGEELFQGLGPCELITDALMRDPSRGNSIELMTAPTRLVGNDELFSMVARLTAVSMPYSSEVYLRISASKRTWATTMPGPKRNAPFGVRGYVIGPGRPFHTVSLSRSAQQGWEFGDDYAEWLQISNSLLPKTLLEATGRHTPDTSGWWAGLPLLTTLFDSVPQRTVFEGDELDLRDEVIARLPDVLQSEIPFRVLQLPRRSQATSVAMLKPSDLGLAGQALDEPDAESSEDDDDEEVSGQGNEERRRSTIEKHREQNIRALQAIHNQSRPVLWSFCSSKQEREVIARTVEQLFGNSVDLRTEPLPENTHGLKEKLPGAALSQRERFNLRVKAWESACKLVRTGPASRHVLICAPDREGGKAEDPVNYYAGLHAMCKDGDANVHHLLPIGGGDATKALQHFVHRLQSALLDVFFAHSGAIFGTQEFLGALFGAKSPKYVYGVQAVRSQARSFSGEEGASFLLFTRLHIGRGTTDVRFVYRSRQTTARTDWKPLSDGLRWLGSQRTLESDEKWLKDSAALEIRDLLGELAMSDPRAIVLVDWPTMTSLWKGISDEDLTRDLLPRIDGKEIAARCPQMTLVRLRRGENTIALRAQSTSVYQRSGQRPEFGGLEATGEFYTDTYATTTKAIVALSESEPSTANTTAHGHFIQSMGYRNTVQIVRGQSCYRPTQRMRKAKGSKTTFELGVLEPGQQDAALPSPLEITVMACPPDLNPDEVATAILGLRLGYVHYNDWTALPAPLFFRRKVDDYVVRYRSPGSIGGGDLADAAIVELPGLEEKDLVAGPESTPDGSSDAEAAQSPYLLEAAKEVAPEAAGQAAGPPPLGLETGQTDESASSAAPTEAHVSDEELETLAENNNLDDGELLRLVQRLGHENFTLCGRSADFRRRKLYGSMMRGQLRVHVPTPSFVTASEIFGDHPPTDKEAFRRFWRDQHELEWVRHGEPMPQISKVPTWILRRLQIPQGGYSVWSSRLFARRPMFYVLYEQWCRYIGERKENAKPDDDEASLLTEEDLDLGELTTWAVENSNDRLISWLVVGCAHFPFVDGVLLEILPKVRTPIGPATREAMFYFIDCVRASRAVIRGDVLPREAGFHLPARAGAVPRVPHEAQPFQESPVESIAAVPPPRATIEVSAMTSRPEVTKLGRDEPATASSTESADLAALIKLLVPGAPNFKLSIASLRSRLEELEAQNDEVERLAELSRLDAERQARALEEDAIRIRQVKIMRVEAEEIVAEMRAALPDMQGIKIELLPEWNAGVEALAASLSEFRALLSAAKSAQVEFETVDKRATPHSGATPREAARHRVQWQSALGSAHEMLELALSALSQHLRASPLFLVSDGESKEESALPQSGDGDVITASPAKTAPSSDLNSISKADNLPGVQPERTELAEPSLQAGEVGDKGLNDSSSADTDEDVDDAQVSLEPVAQRDRARVVSELLRFRAFAAASTYLQSIQQDQATGNSADHALVAASAIESLRRLRNEGGGSHTENARLRERMQDPGLQLPGCAALASNLGVLAAGICEMLLPGPDTDARWTYINFLQHRFSEHGELREFLERIESLEGIYLAQEVLTNASIGARQAAMTQVSQMRERAKRWHADDALYLKWTAPDYRNLHEALFSNEDYPIAKCIGLISRGEDADLEIAFREADRRMSRPLNVIEDMRKRIGRRRPFDGVARGHISGNIELTQSFIREYIEAVRRAEGLNAPSTGSAQAVLQGLYQSLVLAIQAVEKLQFADQLERMYRDLASSVLVEVKRMFDCEQRPEAIPEPEQFLMLRLPVGLDGRPSVEPQSDSTGNPIPAVVEPLMAIEEIESFARRVNDAWPNAVSETWRKAELQRACDDHLTHSRLIPAKLIDSRLGRSIPRISEQNRALASLRSSLNHERQRVAHAMALGALTQAEASRMMRLIEEMLQIAPSLGELASAPAATPDFPHAIDALRRLVTQPLDAQLAKSKTAFSDELDQYFLQNAGTLGLATEIERIRALAQDRGASSMRAARDMFSLLKEGALPKKIAASQQTLAHEYVNLVQEMREMLGPRRPLIESLAKRLREQREDADPKWLAALDSDARLESALFLEKWERVFDSKSQAEFQHALVELLRGLTPLEANVSFPQGGNNASRVEFHLENAPFAGLDRTIGGAFVPPSLGSGAQYIQGIVVRRTAGEGGVTQAIDEAGPALLLARTSWSLERRSLLSRSHPILLVDDSLIAYAAVHPQDRLRKLLQVALLTFNANPYDDYGRPVPPEMFFGRQSELRRLRNVKTAAVLYGGRRLGKSSLLDQLQRDAQRRTDEVALYITLDRIDRGVSDDHVTLAWTAIYRRLIQAKLLEKPKREPASAQEIRAWLEDEILAERCKARGIYLLIDEADELMGRDLNLGGPFISGLVRLCEAVYEKCALRFVVAGLHNLTRMANDENSALGKFEAIALKPFWSAEDIQRGVDLIKTPLEALGFYFGEGKEDLPLRIMAVCNFYPAFIQLYCKRLVEHLNVRRERAAPPTYITESDLDRVEMDKDFLADIRSKFKLNLDLDKRYAAIALVLADQYYSDGAKALTSTEVRNLCDLVASRHFETTGPGACEALLEEMETLTILEKVGARYALRTPNIAMMLGDRQSITQQLDALAVETPVQSRSRGENRPLLVSAGPRREQHTFPFPSAWVRQVFNTSTEQRTASEDLDRQLLLLVGNDLSGLTQLSKLRGEWQLGESVSCQFGVYQSPNMARSVMVRGAKSSSSFSRRLHVIGSGGWALPDLAEYGRLAKTVGVSSKTSGTEEHGAVTRVALIANPARAYELAKALSSQSQTAGNWRVAPVPACTDDALYFRLERLERPELCNSDVARRALLSASCGFTAEIERITPESLRLEEALIAPEKAQKSLTLSLQTFYEKIGFPAAIEQKDLRDTEDLLRELDGKARNPELAEDLRLASGVRADIFVFVQWMGLIQDGPGGTWQVPPLYRKLLS